MKKAIAVLMIILVCFAVTEVFATERSYEGISLTIYTQDLALVKDYRLFSLEKGENKLEFNNISSQIEPTSLYFRALTSPESYIFHEQSYVYDLASGSKLLSKYIDKNIKVITKTGKLYEGRLLSYDADNLILSLDKSGEIIMLNRRENLLNIKLPKLSEGLITKPTLILDIESKRKTEEKFELSYLTRGISWKADYVAVVDEGEEMIDLDAWISIDNKSGASYEEARLKLIAGDIHRVEETTPVVYQKMADMEAKSPFKEKVFFEYHLYTLKRPITIKDKQTKQVSLFSADNIHARKIFVFEGANKIYPRYIQGKQKVKVMLELVNSVKQGLGIPLPKGTVRVYKKDEDGDLEFVGEELIKHIPKDEKIGLYIGDTFDIVGERKQIATHKISDRVREESFQIKLRNHKEEAVEVIVVEHLSQTDWTIIHSSHDYTRKDMTTVEFKIAVPNDGETSLDYTVRYRW